MRPASIMVGGNPQPFTGCWKIFPLMARPHWWETPGSPGSLHCDSVLTDWAIEASDGLEFPFSREMFFRSSINYIHLSKWTMLWVADSGKLFLLLQVQCLTFWSWLNWIWWNCFINCKDWHACTTEATQLNKNQKLDKNYMFSLFWLHILMLWAKYIITEIFLHISILFKHRNNAWLENS